MPAAGQAVSIGTNVADSIRPAQISRFNWAYSLFQSFGTGALVPDFSSAGAFVIAASGGHNVAPNVDAAVFDFSDATWKLVSNSNGIVPRNEDYTDSEGDAWQAKVQMAINDHGKERTVAEMVHQRIGDYEAFGDYQRAVFARTEAWLADLDPAELTRLIVPRPLPPVVYPVMPPDTPPDVIEAMRASGALPPLPTPDQGS